MGCSSSVSVDSSKFVPVTGPSSRNGPLTKEEKLAIRSSWEVVSLNREHIGRQIYLRLFEQKPEVKDLFSFREAWGDELITHPDFRSHIIGFMAAVQKGIEELDSLELKYAPFLQKLGAKHTRTNGFNEDNFTLFEDAIIYILRRELSNEFNVDKENAWKTFLRYIINTMAEGYNETKKSEGEETE